MREIKFRAWSNEENKYYYDLLVENEKFIYKIDDGYIDDRQLKNYCLEQYTGLKDKNGQEIYEGDLIHIALNDFEINRVGYDDFYLRFRFIPDSYYFIQKQHQDHYEVVGNIHENKELLEEIK